VELAGQQEGFRKQGLAVASLIPEPVETLRAFADRFGIRYPILSDAGSAIIKRLGLVDAGFKSDSAEIKDIPFAGTFVVDERGVVRARFFEKSSTDRRTGGSILVLNGAPGSNATQVRTDHFSLRTSQSNVEVAPGQRIALALDFELEEKHHLYAVGDHSYRPARLSIAPDPLLEVHEIRWPQPRPYYFAPLKETVPVFEGAFRVLVDVTLRYDLPAGSPERAARVEATLDHQVCSETVCYPPGRLSLSWPLELRPWVR
jgi:hypothetical protein